MKDLVESVELGVSQRKGVHLTRPKVWLKNELVRVGLAESLCTYVMMVRKRKSLEKMCKALNALTALVVIMCNFKLPKNVSYISHSGDNFTRYLSALISVFSTAYL